jgi:uncharacterized protein (DUF1697 family)
MREHPRVLQVAFLRAVNLGSRTVKMGRIVEVMRRLGYEGAWTHIASGNVVFDAPSGRSALEAELGDAFEAELGFECTTFVRSAKELRTALALDPFPVAKGDTYFLTFLKAAPSAKRRAALEALSNDYDTLVVRGRDVHWRMHGLSSATRIPTRAWEQVIGRHTSTSRNTTMLRKLVAKLDA